MRLSLVVPCFNEQDTVEKFYEAVKNAFTNHIEEYEIIFVNDGSKDTTLEKLHQLYDREEVNMQVVSFSRNFGKESAMYAGLQQAKGDYVTIIDADLQQRPEIVLKMVKKLDENPQIDCVAAYQKERNEGVIISFFKKTFYKIINKMTEVEFVSGASDFRTFRQSVNQAILKMTEYDRFSKGIFSWVGFNVYYMPYKVQNREGGSSKWSFVKLFRYAIDGIVAFTTSPLKWAIGLGSTTLLVSFVYFIIFLLHFILHHTGMTTVQCLIGLLIFFNGIVILILGIIGEYLSKLYMQGKRRPIYIAKEILNNEDEKDEK